MRIKHLTLHGALMNKSFCNKKPCSSHIVYIQHFCRYMSYKVRSISDVIITLLSFLWKHLVSNGRRGDKSLISQLRLFLPWSSIMCHCKDLSKVIFLTWFDLKHLPGSLWTQISGKIITDAKFSVLNLTPIFMLLCWQW